MGRYMLLWLIGVPIPILAADLGLRRIELIARWASEA